MQLVEAPHLTENLPCVGETSTDPIADAVMVIETAFRHWMPGRFDHTVMGHQRTSFKRLEAVVDGVRQTYRSQGLDSV